MQLYCPATVAPSAPPWGAAPPLLDIGLGIHGSSLCQNSYSQGWLMPIEVVYPSFRPSIYLTVPPLPFRRPSACPRLGGAVEAGSCQPGSVSRREMLAKPRERDQARSVDAWGLYSTTLRLAQKPRGRSMHHDVLIIAILRGLARVGCLPATLLFCSYSQLFQQPSRYPRTYLAVRFSRLHPFRLLYLVW